MLKLTTKEAEMPSLHAQQAARFGFRRSHVLTMMEWVETCQASQFCRITDPGRSVQMMRTKGGTKPVYVIELSKQRDLRSFIYV